jgi:hypothetical protein
MDKQRKISNFQSFIVSYGTRNYPNPLPLNPPTTKRIVKKRFCEHGFMETPQLWEDLVEIGNKISKIAVG